MDVYALKKLCIQRDIICKAGSNATFSVLEPDDTEVQTKLMYGLPYKKTDIQKCVEDLLKKNKHISDNQVHVVEGTKKLNINPAEWKKKKPFFVLYGRREYRWVLTCIIYDNHSETCDVLHIDPSSSMDIPTDLKDYITEKSKNVNITTSSKAEIKKNNDKFYGPLCVRNLKNLFKKELDEKLNPKMFKNVQFSTIADVSKAKITVAHALVTKLSKNKEFKSELNKFINKLPPATLCDNVEKYQEEREKLLKKKPPDLVDQIERLKKKYLNPDDMKKYQKECDIMEKSDDANKKVEAGAQIEKDFPLEMFSLQMIFLTVGEIKDINKRKETLRKISEELDMDMAKMKRFVENLKEEEEEEPAEDVLKPIDINDIEVAEKHPPPPPDNDIAPFVDLLQDITVGMDETDSAKAHLSGKDIKELTAKVHSIKEKYETKFKNYQKIDINNWAKKTIGHLGRSDDDICETIAIMDRAFNLQTAYRFRDTQILATLMYFHGKNDKGKLCEIQTGEGKTLIVSLLAVIMVLQGLTVDVITSNLLLATDNVNETRAFYSIFDLTVSTNDPSKQSTQKSYRANVLYGTISGFQFDYLRETMEGWKIRQDRKFEQVILDEVDSMLIDNGGNLAKLAAPYPGMECLKYIYINIWKELAVAHDIVVKDLQAKIIKFNKEHPNNKKECEHYANEITADERKIIKDKIRKSNPTDIPLIYPHLKEYVQSRLELWLKNALHAKYNCLENEQYRIIKNDTDEDVIAPIDYLNTGVTLNNTIWSNGLHQFIQLKHNLTLTFESLTSSFISNIGYIKKFENKRIFGLTGTLGSRAEKELLSDVYKVDYAKLPTYKKKKFEELPGIIVPDNFWHIQLTTDILEKIDNERAVLVICETVNDLLQIKKNLETLESQEDFRIRIYASENDSDETHKKALIGDIILATNIAGRGTNFKTEKTLEQNGGLHVCVGFLPCNSRVENQAFGRTSRQGNSGTAQLIIRESEVDELEILEKDPTFIDIKNERNEQEKMRLDEIKDNLIPELNFKDKLFSKFAKYHKTLKEDNKKPEFRIYLKALKEYWAFWLENQDYRGKTLKEKNVDVEQEYNSFSKKIETKDEIIKHNPFYCISLAAYYFESTEEHNLKKGKKFLDMALGPNENNNTLLVGAYLKLFEYNINLQNPICRFMAELAMDVCRPLADAIASLCEIRTDLYVLETKKNIEKVLKGISIEIEYIDKIFKNGDLEKIMVREMKNNFFFQHLISRSLCLQIHKGNFEQLRKEVIECEVWFAGIEIAELMPTTYNNMVDICEPKELRQSIKEPELFELHSIGIDTAYALRIIGTNHDSILQLLIAALVQINVGILALVAAIACPVTYFILSPVGKFLVSEGISDFIMLCREFTTFEKSQWTEYWINKLKSFAWSVFTFAISQCITLLKTILKCCRRISQILRKAKYLKKICEAIAKKVDSIAAKLELAIEKAKFHRLSSAKKLERMDQAYKSGDMETFNALGGLNGYKVLIDIKEKGGISLQTTKELMHSFIKSEIKVHTKEILKDIIKEQLKHEFLSEMLDKLNEAYRETFKKEIKSNKNLMNVLKKYEQRVIISAAEKIIEKLIYLIEKLAENVGKILDALIDNEPMTLSVTDQIILPFMQIDLVKAIIQAMQQQMVLTAAEIINEDIDATIEEICKMFSNALHSSLVDDMVKRQKFICHLPKIPDRPQPDIKPIQPKLPVLNGKEKNPFTVLGLLETDSFANVKTRVRTLILQIDVSNELDVSAKKQLEIVINAYKTITDEFEKQPPQTILDVPDSE